MKRVQAKRSAGGIGTLSMRCVAVLAVAALCCGPLAGRVLAQAGTLWSWGWNAYGQLGDGTDTDRYTPVSVLAPGGVSHLSEISAISAGPGHSLAVKTDVSIDLVIAVLE